MPKTIYNINQDGSLDLNLHPGQGKAYISTARFVLILAGTQGGKTSFGPWWLYNEIQKCGEGDYLAVTTNFDLFKLKMLPEMKTVFCNLLNIGRYWAGTRVIELRNPKSGKFQAKKSDDKMWGRIILRSVAAESGLESSTANAAWLDEVGMDEWDVNHLYSILARLSLAVSSGGGRILGTTTLYNLGWLKTEWYDRWQEGDPLYDVIQFDSRENPAFPEEEYQRAKNTMPEWKFDMRYRGRYARPIGLVYNCFDELKHLVEKIDFETHWRRVVGLDFGGTNHCQLWLAEHPTETVDVEEYNKKTKKSDIIKKSVWYAYKCTLGPGTSKEHANRIKKRIRDENIYDITVVGGAPSETQARRDIADNGVDVFQPAIGDLEAGIDRVYQFVKEGRLRVHESLVGLRDEFGKYRYKLDSAGEPTDIINNKNNFHRLDALRYGIIYIVEGHGDVKQAGVWRPS